jgi:hypothetical protein
MDRAAGARRAPLGEYLRDCALKAQFPFVGHGKTYARSNRARAQE